MTFTVTYTTVRGITRAQTIIAADAACALGILLDEVDDAYAGAPMIVSPAPDNHRRPTRSRQKKRKTAMTTDVLPAAHAVIVAVEPPAAAATSQAQSVLFSD